jgi:hypothetical protein
MITKRYLYDLDVWEVVILAENAKDDRLVGSFHTIAEADACIVGLIHE